MADKITLNSDATKHVQAYLDYVRLTGDYGDDKMMSEQDYEKFMERIKKNSKNRIYCSWRNTKGLDCKMIGPESRCFCDHRYKQHNYLEAKDKKVHCKVPKCTCPCFSYIPVSGSSDFKCLCKHSFREHDPITKKCKTGKCGGCNVKFQSSWSCSCGYKYGEHVTILENREERISQGKPTDDMMRMMGELDAPHGAGGLMSFQNLIDGAERYEEQINQLGGVSKMHPLALKEKEEKKMLLGNVQPGPMNRKANMLTGGEDSGIDIKPPSQKTAKLANLNKKIQDGINENKYLGNQDDDPRAKMKVYDREEEEDDGAITALKLFQTPHIYSRITIPVKKPALKY